eukprot:7267194-Prymnesium_polylepis.1
MALYGVAHRLHAPIERDAMDVDIRSARESRDADKTRHAHGARRPTLHMFHKFRSVQTCACAHHAWSIRPQGAHGDQRCCGTGTSYN